MKKRKTGGHSGQGLLEYAIVAALITLLVILFLNLLGVNINQIFKDLIDKMGGNDPAMIVDDSGGQNDGEESPPESEIINFFTDDFENGTSNWTRVRSTLFNGNWLTQQGKLKGTQLGATLLNNFSRDDFIVSVDGVELKSVGKKYEGYGIFFRASNENAINGYMVEVEKKDSKDPGLLYFSKWENGYQIVPPLASTTVPDNFDWENPGDFKVAVQGNTFTAYLDGKEMLTAKDDTYNKGTIGISVNSGSQITLDSVRVDSTP